MAHELGHLLNDGHLQGVASLRGCCRSPDEEVRADARGVEVLRASGLDPAAMTAMLTKVRNLVPDAPVCRREIGHRIELLAQTQRQN
jgi:predicted Zn-dependent protease